MPIKKSGPLCKRGNILFNLAEREMGKEYEEMRVLSNAYQRIP